MNYLKYLVEEIHTTVMATVDHNGLPVTSAIDMMEYDESDALYHLALLQKQGYYSYQFLQVKPDGTTAIPESEGNFHETSNTYQAFTYYRPLGGRTWLLVAYNELTFP